MNEMVKKIVKGAEEDEKLGFKRSHNPVLAPRSGVITKAELSAQDKAQILIEEAQKEVDRIQQEAEGMLAHVQSEMEKAKKEGYRKGKEEGQAELTEEILKIRKLKEEFFANSEPEMIKLVMAIAEKVIGKLVEEHKEAIDHSLGDRIVVRLHPDDLKRLRTEDLQFKNILDRTKHLHFKEDDTIQKGGCVVETEVGTIDAQLENQLKAIRKALGV